MNQPIDNMILSVQNPVKPDFSTFDKKPNTKDLIFEKIDSGTNKGFYRQIPPLIRGGNSVPFTKVFFPEQIKNVYRDYIPYYKGFYYVPKSDIPIRKLVYGLQNYDMPPTSNTDEMMAKFNSISVPNNFCPYVDPCIYDWCEKCSDTQNLNTQTNRVQIGYKNVLYLFCIICIISLIVTLSFS